MMHCATILVWRSNKCRELSNFYNLTDLYNSKTQQKWCHLQASFYVTNYVNDHVIGIPRFPRMLL